MHFSLQLCFQYLHSLNAIPPNFYSETLTPNETIFRYMTFRGVITVEWSHQGKALIWWDWCPMREGDPQDLALSLSEGVQKKAM